uniref:Heme chaperone HemW n=1 Tax=Candidatus Kentrum sp. DK TaxID=2126562 RepID=A0A450SCQ6_9GAMM|nr:MAG: oxygen-independent coproporphyrinogen-3 oxidase [Candidatus Kentron sp. DK]
MQNTERQEIGSSANANSAGIYLHIPYCRRLCYYCDFHFSLSLRDKDEMLDAMAREMELRGDYLPPEITAIDTLYFGGGTPSVLAPADIGRLLDKLTSRFPVSRRAEITLEANPDDLTPAYLSGLRALGVNRLSIGVQSFWDHELATMGRRHGAGQARQAVEDAFRCGFENITLDLIYGLPDSTRESWSHSLEMALGLSPPHLSCYHLSFEEKTVFGGFLRKGKLGALPEQVSQGQYQHLCERMAARGYEHYEIANFARPGWQSRHNRAYWAGVPYLGIGPAAHSFDGKNRQWNVANNRKYREGVERGTGFYEREVLSERDRFHDCLLTRLRTKRGLDLPWLRAHFPGFYPGFYRRLGRYFDTDLLRMEGDRCRLTEEGFFRSDAIIGDLFLP